MVTGSWKKGNTGRYLPLLWVLGLWLTFKRTTDATPQSFGRRYDDTSTRRPAAARPDSNSSSAGRRGGWRFPSLQRIQILRRSISVMQEQSAKKSEPADDHRWTIPGQKAFKMVQKRGRQAWKLLLSSSGRERTVLNQGSYDRTVEASSSTSRACWSFPGKQAMDWLRQKRRGGHSSRSFYLNDVENDEKYQESHNSTNAPTPPTESQSRENPSIELLTLKVKPGDQYVTISVIDTTSDTRTHQQRKEQAHLELDTVTTVWKVSSTTSMQPAWQTLALLSDKVVLVMDSGSTQRQDGVMQDWSFWNALLAGWKQRQRAGLSRGQLVLVVEVDDDDDDNVDNMHILREKIVLQRPELTPDILGNFEIVSLAEYNCHLDMIPLADSTSSIVEREALEAVVQQAYRNLGGEDELFWDLDTEKRNNRTANLEVAKSQSENVRSSNSAPEPSFDKQEGLSVSEDIANIVAEDEPKEMVNDRPKGTRSGWGLPFFRRKRNTAFLSPSSKAMDTRPEAQNSFSETVQAAVQSIFVQLDNLQTIQESNLLDDEAGNLPIDFASHADPILDALEVLPSVPTHVNDIIRARLREMYQQHMERLRDHFGKMYETLLEHQHPKAWDAVRARVVISFRETAAKAVPKLAREGGPFRDMDLDYIVSLAGLESDLEAITELRRELSGDDEDSETEVDTESSRRRKRILRVCKRLAARALMLGVNYLQGWLAWQGIKRTALERERNFPKFPLF